MGVFWIERRSFSTSQQDTPNNFLPQLTDFHPNHIPYRIPEEALMDMEEKEYSPIY